MADNNNQWHMVYVYIFLSFLDFSFGLIVARPFYLNTFLSYVLWVSIGILRFVYSIHNKTFAISDCFHSIRYVGRGFRFGGMVCFVYLVYIGILNDYDLLAQQSHS